MAQEIENKGSDIGGNVFRITVEKLGEDGINFFNGEPQVIECTGFAVLYRKNEESGDTAHGALMHRISNYDLAAIMYQDERTRKGIPEAMAKVAMIDLVDTLKALEDKHD